MYSWGSQLDLCSCILCNMFLLTGPSVGTILLFMPHLCYIVALPKSTYIMTPLAKLPQPILRGIFSLISHPDIFTFHFSGWTFRLPPGATRPTRCPALHAFSLLPDPGFHATDNRPSPLPRHSWCPCLL